MNLKPPAEESESIQSDSISNEMIIGMAGILLIIVLVIFINKNSNSNAHLLRQELPDVEQEVSDDKTDTNEEKDSETGTTGLLARAKKI
jgi:hypothetical protein